MSERRPVIGLTTSELHQRPIAPGTVPEDQPTRADFALGVSYVRAVESAGGTPVILPPLDSADLPPPIDRLDGLCVPGGPDIDPAAYGAEPHPKLGPVDARIDRFELDVIRRADQADLPILAICRGAQALNVVRGGSLLQHLPDLGSQISHRQSLPGTETAHAVTVEPQSELARIVDQKSLEVNTFHHQGIERLGRGLRAVAFAPDGTIEALEADDRRFCLGVQWHAETLTHHPEQAALFSALVAASATKDRAATLRGGVR